MEIYDHPDNNFKLVGPEGCLPLPCTVGTVEGVPAFTSYWLPTPEELAALNARKAVALTVYGERHPMVWVGVEAELTHVIN